MNKIDGSYRLLFSNPQLVRDLCKGMLNEPALGEFDWDALQPLPSDYISNDLRQRYGDCVWRVPRQGGDSLFVLLMLEHQSKNDRIMALRLATYCALLYESLLARKLIKKSQRFPLVLPVVIYSGVRPWRAPRCMSDLIDHAPSGLKPYVLQMCYVVVDEGELVRQQALPEDNLASLLFRLEHNQGIADVQNLMQNLWYRTAAPEFAEVRRAFTAWAKYVLLPRALPNVALPPVDTLLEIKDMIEDHSRSWTHQWKAEGWKAGLTEGRQVGTSTVLQRLLHRKFGVIPLATQQKIKAATSEQLETWSLNILDATTLDEVFKD